MLLYLNMSLKSIKKIRALKEEQLNKIIKSAWQDRISFEEIKESLGFTEAEVITVMQRELKPGSFRLWRKRVSGRLTKHKKLCEYKINQES